MKLLLASLLLIGVCSAQQPWETEVTKKTTCDCGWYNRNRIVGGKEAGRNNYPLVVALLNSRGTQYCGGTIISKRHILTAAHCTNGRMVSQISVNVGAHNLQEGSEGVYKLADMIVHPKYDHKHYINDIAILVLEKPLKFSRNVGPACMPTKRLDLTGKKVRALGWGLTSHKGVSSDTLMEVDLTVIPYERCLEAWWYGSATYTPEEETNMCTMERRQDSCNGDSGGPLIWLDPETNSYTIVALVSYGGVCAGKLPAVNTDVTSYVTWINDVVKSSVRSTKTCYKKN